VPSCALGGSSEEFADAGMVDIGVLALGAAAATVADLDAQCELSLVACCIRRCVHCRRRRRQTALMGSNVQGDQGIRIAPIPARHLCLDAAATIVTAASAVNGSAH